jgi:hypothetical protein
VSLPLSQRQFIRIDIDTYSPAVLSRLLLYPYIRTASSGKRYIIFRIDQTMYGLKEAGKLSNLRLVSLRSSVGFIETRTSFLFSPPNPPYSLCPSRRRFRCQIPKLRRLRLSCLFSFSPLPGQGASRHHKILGLRPRPRPRATHADPLLPRLHQRLALSPSTGWHQARVLPVDLRPASLRFMGSPTSHLRLLPSRHAEPKERVTSCYRLLTLLWPLR